MFVPSVNVVPNGKQPLKSARENKTFNSSIAAVETTKSGRGEYAR
jgi:hypothetical protein